MIEKMAATPAGVLGVRVTGWVLREDFDGVRPLVEDAIRRGTGIRALIQIDDTFAGITPGGMVADLALGVHAFRHWTGCAIVTPGWLRTSARVAGRLVPWPVRVFDTSEIDAARSWLDGLGERPDPVTPAAPRVSEQS